MKNIKKLLTLSISLLIIVSQMSVNVMAAEDVIIWKAGYKKNDGTSAGYPYIDIPYTITRSDGSEGNIDEIGTDYNFHMVLADNNHFVNYNVIPNYTGVYRLDVQYSKHIESPDYLGVYANDIEIGMIEVTDGTYCSYAAGPRPVGYVVTEAGVPVKISFSNRIGSDPSSSIISIMDCQLTYMPEPTLEDTSIKDGDTVSCSTDVITLKYSRELDAEKIEDADVRLTYSYKDIPITLEVDDKDPSMLNIILNEALSYGEKYTLYFSGIKDEIGYRTDGETIDFSVYEESEDQSEDNSTVTVDTLNVEDTTFTLTGTYRGSKSQPVKGREVTASFISPLGGESVALSNVKTDEDGKFTFIYALSSEEENNSGEYTFSVDGQFAVATATGSKVRYISENERASLLGSLQAANTADEVEAFFANTDNSAMLGADISTLDKLGANKSLFYDRLANSTFTNEKGDYDISVFENMWHIAYSLEDINLSDDDDITASYFEDAVFCEAIAFNTVKYELLNAQKVAFITAVTNLGRQEDAESFGIKCDKLLDEMILIENGKSSPILKLSDNSVYIGQTANIDIDLTETVSDISGYTLTITCPNSTAASKVEFTEIKGTESLLTKTENLITVEVKDIDTNLNKLGAFSYSASEEMKVPFSVNGVVTFKIGGVDIKCPVITDTATILVRRNNNKTESGKSVSVARVSNNANASTSVPATNPDDMKDEDLKEMFSDLDEVTWAKNSIIFLYEKGVISEAQDGRFRPNDSVTRAEFVKMLATALRITDKSASVEFGDVSQNDWYYQYISAAVNYGLVVGDDKGNFLPNADITRQDVCVIISRAMDKLGYGEIAIDYELFYDDAQISDYAKAAVYRMRIHEIVNGFGDGSFAPLANANRASTAKMVEKFMKEARI